MRQGRLAFALCGQCAMRGEERFRQDRLAPSSTTLGMLALGLCALVGPRNASSNEPRTLFEAKRKERLAHRPITCDYSEHMALNAQKALKEGTQTLRVKPKSNAERELPMEEENECTGMTTDEMQRFFDMKAEQGTSELEAYRKLMRILGIEFPSKE